MTVFDVDIGDGEPIRKLPYNRNGIFLLFSLGTSIWLLSPHLFVLLSQLPTSCGHIHYVVTLEHVYFFGYCSSLLT